MNTNIDRYKEDLSKLITQGTQLQYSMQYRLYPKETVAHLKKMYESDKKADEKVEAILKKLPEFANVYQHWYSEALGLIKQLLPDRLADFIKFYEKPKTRKDISYTNYVIEDYLQGLRVTKGHYQDKVVGPDAAYPQFQQQLNVLKSVERRFESSLFDIRQLVQADLFDSELASAKELAKHKFIRAAGAVAGVVLEKHLLQVSQNHNIPLGKKNPTINDFNELLKNNNVIDTPQWRFIQLLGDLRNLCDHNKEQEPTLYQANDLISGVEKIIKTIF